MAKAIIQQQVDELLKKIGEHDKDLADLLKKFTEYLPLSGGKMTGAIEFEGAGVLQIQGDGLTMEGNVGSNIGSMIFFFEKPDISGNLYLIYRPKDSTNWSHFLKIGSNGIFIDDKILRGNIPNYNAGIAYGAGSHVMNQAGWILVVEGFKSSISINGVTIASSSSYNYYTSIMVDSGDTVQSGGLFYLLPLRA